MPLFSASLLGQAMCILPSITGYPGEGRCVPPKLGPRIGTLEDTVSLLTLLSWKASRFQATLAI